MLIITMLGKFSMTLLWNSQENNSKVEPPISVFLGLMIFSTNSFSSNTQVFFIFTSPRCPRSICSGFINSFARSRWHTHPITCLIAEAKRSVSSLYETIKSAFLGVSLMSSVIFFLFVWAATNFGISSLLMKSSKHPEPMHPADPKHWFVNSLKDEPPAFRAANKYTISAFSMSTSSPPPSLKSRHWGNGDDDDDDEFAYIFKGSWKLRWMVGILCPSPIAEWIWTLLIKLMNRTIITTATNKNGVDILGWTATSSSFSLGWENRFRRQNETTKDLQCWTGMIWDSCGFMRWCVWRMMGDRSNCY